MASLGKLLKIGSNPRLWRGLVRGVAASVEHGPALARFNFKTVIDIGANKGQFASFAQSQWPQAALYCFEPLAAPRAILASVTTGDVTIFDCALGARTGEATIHIATREDSSSLLPLGAQKEVFHMEEARVETVPVRRLDDVIPADSIRKPALLKIDVQGFEGEVLKGGTKLLGAVQAVYVELSHVELYEGQALAPEINAMLNEHGLREVGAFNMHKDARGAPIQADYLFERV